jgi:hypothetical protein
MIQYSRKCDAGAPALGYWMPAFAGMTATGGFAL